MDDVEVLVKEPWGLEGEHRKLRRFSVGIVTQSLLRLGMTTEEALRIAHDVRDELEGCGAKRVRHSELHGMLLSRLEGLDTTEARYADRLRYLDERDGTLVVLVGGTSGSGKSTVAARVARRLGIEHMVGTDSLREALRSAIPPGVAPALHESSYTAHRTLTSFVGEDAKVERLGFLEHARPVATGLNGLLRRARTEGTRVVVEGIHVVPSLIEETYHRDRSVIITVVSVPDEQEHRRRFLHASRRDSRRKNANRYLDNFSTIREIHDFIAEDAAKHQLPVVDSGEPERAASEIVERLWRRILD